MHFSEVQTELATCENLLVADGPDWLAQEYQELVSITRSTAGREAHEAWKVGPITEDVEMNMPDLFGRLKPLNDEIERSASILPGLARREGREFAYGADHPGVVAVHDFSGCR